MGPSYLASSPCRCILDSQAYAVLVGRSGPRAISGPPLPSLRHRQASSTRTALALPPPPRSALRAALMSDVGVPSANCPPLGVAFPFLSRLCFPASAIEGAGALPILICFGLTVG